MEKTAALTSYSLLLSQIILQSRLLGFGAVLFSFSGFFAILAALWMSLCCGNKEPYALVIVPNCFQPALKCKSTRSAELRGIGCLATMKDPEPGLLEGFILCLRDSEAIRIQTSQWKRNLLFFSSGVCLEIAALPVLADWLGYDLTWPIWLITSFFLPLGLVGMYASKFGNDRFVERLLVIPKLDLKI